MNIDLEYNKLITKILEEGREKSDRTGTGSVSIPFATIEHDMSNGFPLLTTKRMFVHGVIHELLWFLNGDSNIKYLVDNGVNIWTADAHREYKKIFVLNNTDGEPMSLSEFTQSIKKLDSIGWDLGPIYGVQWRKWKTETGFIDQIQEAINKLNNNPDDRRIMVSAWNVGEIEKMGLPPCHYGFQLYSEELTDSERIQIWQSQQDGRNYFTMELLESGNIPKRRLSLIWDQRSVDVGLGLGFNIASYGILLHMFAQQTNMIPHKLIGSLKNVHIYNNHIEPIKKQITLNPYPSPKIVLNKAKDIFSYTYDDIQIIGYESHPTIKMGLSV